MTKRSQRPWLNYLLGALCVGAIVAAYTSVGAASPSSGAARRFVRAERGVVQSTVSGSGNLEAANQLNLGFRTSGVVTHIYVAQGQPVGAGQLLAALDPQSAEVTLEQAKATLQAAEAALSQEEENEGETAGGSGTGGTSAAAASVRGAAPAVGSSSTTTTATAKQSAATREANLASAGAAVKSDRLAVEGDEQALADTKLFAPEAGTIAALSGEVGETVSATGTTRASAAASSSGSSASSSSSTGSGSGSAGRGSAGSSSSTSSSSAAASSPFAVLSDLGSLELVVPLSESEVGNVKVGQTATVSVEALNGRKLAARVISVATLPTSNSGVVSYDVTFRLDQMSAGLKPGMSAEASVVVRQAEGVSVPTSAISRGTVTVLRGGKDVQQSVVAGLAGDSSTIILSGLTAGEEVALPVTSAVRPAGGGLAARARAGAGPGARGGGFAGGGIAGGGIAGGGIAGATGAPGGG